MKQVLRVGLVVLFCASLMFGADARKKRIAVLDFEYGTVQSSVSAMFGTNVDVGRGIGDLLVKYLVKDGTYSLIERKALDKIMAEQNISNTDRFNPSTAAKLGRLLGVDAIIVGSITQFGGETKGTGASGVGGGLGKFGLGGFSQKKTKAIVAIDARVIDIDTAEILAVAEGKGESSRTSTSMLGGGGGWHGFGAGAVDFSSSGFQDTIIGEAVKAAVEKMSTEVIAANPKLVARTVTVNAVIAFVDQGTVVLNAGNKSGLKVGDRLSVERVTREIKDPSSGQVIRRMTEKIGLIEVSELDDASAVGRIVNGTGFRVGDVAKTPND